MQTVCSRVRTTIVALAFLCGLAGPAVAQTAQARDASPPPQHTGVRALFTDILGDFRHIPSMSNLGPAIVGTGLSLGAHQVDPDVNRHLFGKDEVNGFFLPGKTIGQSPVAIAAAIVTYAVGRESGKPRVAHIGLDLLRAQAVTGVLTLGLKEAVRRERPDGSGPLSFPSGHASVTFTTATVLARHFGWRVAVPTYLLASYVAASRLHENVHFLSDVVAGSTLGYIVGRTVTRHGRTNFAMFPVMERGGGAVMFARVW